MSLGKNYTEGKENKIYRTELTKPARLSRRTHRMCGKADKATEGKGRVNVRGTCGAGKDFAFFIE